MPREVVLTTVGSVTPFLRKLDLFLGNALRKGHVVVTVSRDSLQNQRTLKQNSLMWPLLNDFAHQVVNFDNQKYSAEDWKDILTAAFEGQPRFAPNLYGNGLIALGTKTSKFSKKKMSNFIEFIYAEGCDRGVIWSQQSQDSLIEVRAK